MTERTIKLRVSKYVQVILTIQTICLIVICLRLAGFDCFSALNISSKHPFWVNVNNSVDIFGTVDVKVRGGDLDVNVTGGDLDVKVQNEPLDVRVANTPLTVQNSD